MTDLERCILDVRFAREHMCLNCPYDDILDNAIALLKAQAPRVMTLEETGKADISWLEVKDMNRVMPCRIRYSDGWFIKLFEGSPERFAESEYGTELRCWTSRPTDTQREAERWE